MGESKTEKLNKLFTEWKSNYKSNTDGFAEDGIINEELWNEAKLKVLFLLKETVGFSGDFREYSNNGPWIELGYMNYYIQNTNEVNIPDFRYISADECHKSYRMCSVVNLKKISGKSTSSYEEIYQFGMKDKILIEEEISIIKPEIIVCGGTFDIFSNLFELNNIEISHRVYKSSKFNEALIIDSVHPSQRTRRELVYYTLGACYQNALKSLLK